MVIIVADAQHKLVDFGDLDDVFRRWMEEKKINIYNHPGYYVVDRNTLRHHQAAVTWATKVNQYIVDLDNGEVMSKKLTLLAVDHGKGTLPRFDFCWAPKVGDKVSRTFNGDYYPCGEIVEVSPRWVVKTSDGTKFKRTKHSAQWLSEGTWSMVYGHINERNPSF